MCCDEVKKFRELGGEADVESGRKEIMSRVRWPHGVGGGVSRSCDGKYVVTSHYVLCERRCEKVDGIWRWVELRDGVPYFCDEVSDESELQGDEGD